MAKTSANFQNLNYRGTPLSLMFFNSHMMQAPLSGVKSNYNLELQHNNNDHFSLSKAFLLYLMKNSTKESQTSSNFQFIVTLENNTFCRYPKLWSYTWFENSWGQFIRNLPLKYSKGQTRTKEVEKCLEEVLELTTF